MPQGCRRRRGERRSSSEREQDGGRRDQECGSDSDHRCLRLRPSTRRRHRTAFAAPRVADRARPAADRSSVPARTQDPSVSFGTGFRAGLCGLERGSGRVRGHPTVMDPAATRATVEVVPDRPDRAGETDVQPDRSDWDRRKLLGVSGWLANDRPSTAGRQDGLSLRPDRRRADARAGPSVSGGAGPEAARSRGQAIVELALILPVMLILVAGAIDLGRVFYSTITLANAAREGALEASADPTRSVPGAPSTRSPTG